VPPIYLGASGCRTHRRVRLVPAEIGSSFEIVVAAAAAAAVVAESWPADGVMHSGWAGASAEARYSWLDQ